MTTVVQDKALRRRDLVAQLERLVDAEHRALVCRAQWRDALAARTRVAVSQGLIDHLEAHAEAAEADHAREEDQLLRMVMR